MTTTKTFAPMNYRPAGQSLNTRLYYFLYERLPSFRTKRKSLDVRGLAVALGKSHEAIYKWLRASRIPAKSADVVIGLSRGKITEGQLLKFILHT